MIRSVILAVPAALIMLSTPAMAQSTSGVFVGAQVTGAALNFRDASQKVDFGGGWGVKAGVGLGERLAVLANYDRASLAAQGGGGSYDLGQLDGMVRVNFFDKGALIRPYIAGGVTSRVSRSSTFNGSTGSYKFSGTSPTAGGGAQFFVSPVLAIDGGVHWTFGNFNSVQNSGGPVPGYSKLDATGTRVMVGVTLYPFNSR